jgi:uncharacterized membrane protein YecN with MAPEG domain
MVLNEKLAASAICTALLYIKFFVSNMGLGGAKNNAGRRAPEDFYQKTGLTEEEQQAADAAVDRAQRIVNNDLENIPFGLIIIWASTVSPTAILPHVILVALYTFLRISHTISYALVLILWQL